MSYNPQNPNGQATMANSSPVVLASDQTDVKITLDGETVTIGSSSLPSGAATEATLASLLTSSQLIDDTVVVLGTATYTEASSKGIIIGGVRRDADTTLVDTTNEFAPFQLDANGRLKVEVFTGETLPVSLTSVPTHSVTQSGNWDVRVFGGGGAVIDAVVTANTAPPNMVVTGLLYNSTEISPSTGQSFAFQGDSKGRLRNVIMDGAGNTRAANVTASNELLVSVNNATLAVTATNLDIRDLVAASDAVSIHGDVGILDQLDLTNSNPAVVAIVDGSGNQITSFGGGTQYTEDVAAAADPTGGMMMAVAEDAPLAGVTDGDNVALRASVNGKLHVTSTNSNEFSVLATLAQTSQAGNSIITDIGFLDAMHTVLYDINGTGLEIALDANLAAVSGIHVLGTDGTNGRILSTNTSGHLNIADGGNTITVDGTVAVTQSGTWDEVGINDSGNSITVDAPVGTPVNVQIGNASISAGVVDETGASAVDALAVGGGTPHDAVDSGNPQKMGAKAIAHGTNPTAVAAADRTDLYANRHGILWSIGGHPNLQSAEYFTSGAQTDDPVIAVVSAGTKIVVTSITVSCSAANATTPSVRIGFGTASVPTQGSSGADGVAKVILSHPGIAAGSGIVKGNGAGIVGIGGDGEDLRITCTTPTTSLIVQVDYYTIES